MLQDFDWIPNRIREARKQHGGVTDAASARIEELLIGKLSERRLPSVELWHVAGGLISDMVPARPEAEAEQ